MHKITALARPLTTLAGLGTQRQFGFLSGVHDPDGDGDVVGTLPVQLALEASSSSSLSGLTLYLQALTTRDAPGYAGFTATRVVQLQ